MGKNEISFSFCIWDFNDISHDEISELLGVKPSKVYIKGERKNPKVNALAKKNGWILDPPGCDNYSSFEDQMNSLLDVIESKIEAFRIICKKYYCEFSCGLYIYVDNDESTPWVHLNSRYNNLIRELNIELDVDIILLADSSNRTD